MVIMFVNIGLVNIAFVNPRACEHGDSEHQLPVCEYRACEHIF